MPATIFTPTEFAVFATSPAVAALLAKAHGYTNGGKLGAAVTHRRVGSTDETYPEEFEIFIDQADAQATISANLVAATEAIPLTVVTAIQTVTADGVDTKTYDLDGAPDKVVNLEWVGTENVDKNTLTLDGSGNGSFTVGTYAAGSCTSGSGFEIACDYADRVAAGVVCTVKVAP